MKTIETEITINASIEKVWKILTDFPAYPDWNPFIISISGDLIEGSKILVRLKIEANKVTSFKPTLVSVVPGEKFCWRGSLLIKGIFDGTHYFVLEKTGDKTSVSHGENFNGLLVGPILRRIGKSTQAAFEKMNQALKEKAENQI